MELISEREKLEDPSSTISEHKEFKVGLNSRTILVPELNSTSHKL